MKNKLAEIKSRWGSVPANIFNSPGDALGGLIVLCVIPLISFISTICGAVSSSNGIYQLNVFAIISISFAGVYDALGRPKTDSVKNLKLEIRILLDLLAVIFSALWSTTPYMLLVMVGPFLLLLSGIMIFNDSIRFIIVGEILN